MLALVPALAALVLGYGVFADPDTVARHVASLSARLPAAAAEIIGGQLRSVSEGADSAKGLGLAASAGVALFGARGGARALTTGLNLAFHAGEMRSFVRGNLVALAITAGGLAGLVVVGGLSAAVAVLTGPLGALASLLLLALAATGGAALLYRYAPNTAAPEWRAILPGATLFAVGWMAATAAFAAYAANFGSYNATYGSLGAVIVLITWFYISALMLLLGAELTALKASGKHVGSRESA